MQAQDWNTIQIILSQKVDATRYENWYKPLIFKSAAEGLLILQTNMNKDIADFLNHNHKKIILSVVRQLYPYILDIDIISVLSEKKPVFDKLSRYSFDLFISGPGNEFAKSVAIAVSEKPGKTRFNPLLIYGGVGLGKTHLLHSIIKYAEQKNPSIKTILINSEEFYHSFIEALQNSRRQSFQRQYEDADILLIDDIQFIAGKDQTQEEFFHIFNSIIQKGSQIVLTSDTEPANMKGFHDRLISRFQSGLAVEIQPPDLETRVAIIKNKAQRENISVAEDIIYFIAENVSSNIREIEGVIIKILAQSSIKRTDITLEFVKNIIKKQDFKEKRSFSIDSIIDKISEYYGIPADNIREKNRSKEVALCRQVGMFIAKQSTKHSLKTIGLYFGGRDHSTVIHAINTITKLLEKDETLKKDINYILEQIYK